MFDLLTMLVEAQDIAQAIRETKTVWFDLDGVLADFFGRVKQLKPEGMSLSDYTAEVFEKKTKLTRDFWNQMDYSTLELLPPGLKLLKWTVAQKKNNPHLKIAVLGSTGGKKFHARSKAQKLEWLKTNGLHELFDKIVFVPGKKHKREYAEANSFLIDDTPINIEQFVEDGGQGIVYKNYSKTLAALKKFLEN